MYVHGQLAQSVEQRPEKPRVRSSILRLPTMFFPINFMCPVRSESRYNSDFSSAPFFSLDRISDAEELFYDPQVCQQMLRNTRCRE